MSRCCPCCGRATGCSYGPAPRSGREASWWRVIPGEDRLIVKRAARREDDGWWLESDNQRAAGRQDSWDFGAVPEDLIVGRVVMRYWPRPSLRLGPAT